VLWSVGFWWAAQSFSSSLRLGKTGVCSCDINHLFTHGLCPLRLLFLSFVHARCAPHNPETALAAAKKKSDTKPPKFWVGIGASAGGLEALRGFVRHLPDEASAAYIVTQHVAPQHRSMLTEIIGRETHLPVMEVADKLIPAANTIYITPPNNDLIVEDGFLRLTEPSKQIAAPKPSVNTFFKSLSAAKGKDAIGIILSGTGSDGAIGMTAIHKAGGITIAQDYMTAKYSSMPVAAVDTGDVDLVMSPEEMAAQFSKIVAVPRDLDALRSSPVNMDSLSELTQILLDHTKVNFRHYKTPTFQRRVERRIAATGASSLEAYVDIARKSGDEVEALFRDLLITVTSFFRDKSEFEALREPIREIIKNRDGQAIRVWVAGTATGEEAYTIAIIFAEEMGGPGEFSNARIQIFASDLDSEAIEIARRGYYSETSLVEVPQQIIRRYFQKAPLGYTVSKAIREKIVFSVHNIGQDPPLLNLDLVSCRNLLIYFQPELQRQVLTRFHYALKSRGVLFLGKSETASVAEGLFTSANSEKHIYYQRPSQTPNMLPRDMYQQPNIVTRNTSSFVPTELRELQTIKDQFNSLIKALGPNCLLVDINLKVTQAFGDVSRFVRLAAGPVDGTTTSLLREPFRQDVRAAIPAVIRNAQPYIGLIRHFDDEPNLRVRLRILPIESSYEEETLALIVFEEWKEKESRPRVSKNADQNEFYENEIKSLSDELEIAKSNLMQTVQELETSNEELQALNEELQSSNEELQSTNEELETSNEELQSTNEELSTVNEEMQVNSQQLGSLNQSLNGILGNIAIPLLVVDRNLNITNLSRVGEEFFGISSDLALPHVSRCKLPEGLPDITEMLTRAMTSGKKIEQIVDLDEISATVTIAPHFSNVVDLVGAIVVVSDNTTALAEARDELQRIFDNLPVSVLVRDKAGTVLRANQSSSRLFKKPVKEIEASHMKELCDPKTLKEVKRLDRLAIETQKPVIHQSIEYMFPDGRTRYLDTSRIPVKSAETGEDVIYALAGDVTEEHKARQELEVSERRLDEAVQIAGVGHWEWSEPDGSVYWSPNFERLMGLKVGSFGGTFDDFIIRVHPDDAEHVGEQINAQRTSDKQFDVEYRLRHQKGHSIWIRAYGRNTYDEDGKFSGMAGTVQDVTEAKRTEMEIKERNEQLQLASEMASLGFWKIDVKAQSIFWSSEVYRIYGVQEGRFKLSMKTASDFIHPDDRKDMDALFDRSVKNSEGFVTEVRIVRPNGKIRIVDMHGEVETDAKGKIAYIFGTTHDVTEDREARAALIESENKLEQAINASGLGLWELNVASRELIWSSRYHRMLGLDPDKSPLDPEKLKDLIHPDDRDMVLACHQAHLKDNVPFDCEFRMRHSDGSYVWLHDTAETQRDENGQPIRMIGMIADITDRKLQTLNLSGAMAKFARSAPAAPLISDQQAMLCPYLASSKMSQRIACASKSSRTCSQNCHVQMRS